MTKLEEAEAALVEFKRSVDSGHPWLPGGVFLKLPGLDQHIVRAFEDFVLKERIAEQVKPAKRVSLTD